MMALICVSIKIRHSGEWKSYRIFSTDQVLEDWIKNNELYFDEKAIWYERSLFALEDNMYKIEFVPYFTKIEPLIKPGDDVTETQLD